MILVTGVSGNVGTELARILMARRVSFRAMVRPPEAVQKAGALAGVEIVAGDFNDAGSMAGALAGIDRAFLLTPSSERAEAQQAAFVEVARRASVRHIVKLSQWAATADSPVRFLRYHAAVEQLMRASGLAYTFLRPNLFMQGLLGFRASIRAQGNFFAAAGDAKISAIDVRDIAAVAATALTERGHEGRTYNLTGSEALTHAEMAKHLSDALGSPRGVRRCVARRHAGRAHRRRPPSLAGRGLDRGLRALSTRGGVGGGVRGPGCHGTGSARLCRVCARLRRRILLRKPHLWSPRTACPVA
jgi:uncharacterized protein YbjT (DUF2867 family)